MLGKLAYRNTKRNIKDYLIYLITVTTSFSLIFAFNLVASSDEIVKLCSSMDAFKNSSTTCADMFLTVLLKNKKMKYQNDNLFVARTFASKARTMSFTFGTLSMLILISLLALNYSSINKASYDISVNLNAPYDVQLFDDKQVFDEYIRVIEEEYTIDNTIEYDIYKEPNHQVQNFFQSEYYDFDPVLKLSDYNRLLELRKMPLLSLNDNEFILSQIVQNAIKYFDKQENKLTIYSQDNGTNILLVIEDNGCGIKASDLSRVFEKGFTGSNRNKANATGMGLYLSKKLCDRLGLKLDIASTEKEYTRLTITFPKGTVHNFSE